LGNQSLNGDLIICNMSSVVKSQGNYSNRFKASNMWLKRFLNRNALTMRVPNSTFSLDIVNDPNIINNFHNLIK